MTVSYWSADTSQPVLETTVGGVLPEAAATAPDRLAMVGGVPHSADRKRWTYAELLAEAEQTSGGLSP